MQILAHDLVLTFIGAHRKFFSAREIEFGKPVRIEAGKSYDMSRGICNTSDGMFARTREVQVANGRLICTGRTCAESNKEA